jgi:L-cysteine/cystine lyase
MDTAELRELIPATKSIIYMNTGFTGPDPTPVVDRIRDHLQREALAGPASIEGLTLVREATAEAQSEAAALLHAEQDEVLLTHGTTEGCHTVLHGLTWQAGDELVTCNLEHNALANATAVLQQRHGVAVNRVETPPNATKQQLLDLYGEAITPKTRVVALSHVQYTCGLKLPVPEITEMAHRAGALVLIDGAQTGGVFDLDVHALGVDFYAISGQKWLLGPNATGALYVNPQHFRTIEPLFQTHEIADRRAQRAETDVLANPLGRFRLTSHNPPLLGGFAEAIKLMRAVGLEQVEKHSFAIADRLRAGLRSLEGCSLTGPTDPGSQCSLVSVAVDGWEPPALVEELWTKYHVCVRAVNNPPAIRFSCAAFNTEDEVDRVLEALSELEKAPPPKAD